MLCTCNGIVALTCLLLAVVSKKTMPIRRAISYLICALIFFLVLNLEQIMELALLFLLAMMLIVSVLGGDCDNTGNSRDYEECIRPRCLEADSTDDSSAGCECRLVVPPRMDC